MGDRVNIAVQDGGNRIYLYSQWGGHSAPETVRKALAWSQRWDDPSYLTRIIFCTMIGDNKGETGFGIGTRLDDNEHPILVVDCDSKTVTIEADTREGFDYCKPDGEAKSYSFEAYAALPRATWQTLDTGA